MTRETKIGLLVGLAFIIVIGILLSDHMTSTTQPPQAALTEASSNVRESVTAPAAANPVPTQVVTSQQITPTNQVLTPAEIRQPAAPVNVPPAVTRVEVGGPAGGQQVAGPIAIRQPAAEQPKPTVGLGPVATNEAAVNPGDSTSQLERWAQVGPGGPAVVPAGGSKPAPAAKTATKREYTAQAGDSLSRIAAKTLGSSSKSNIDAIIKANPSLQKNPDLVVEGRKYVIPQSTTAAATATPAAPMAPVAGATGTAAIPDTVPVATGGAKKSVPVTELVDPLPASTGLKDGGAIYVVKDNDNLWKIAAEQLGSGNAWTQIRDMNKDTLKGGDTVQPNMRLRMPPKPLASAN